MAEVHSGGQLSASSRCSAPRWSRCRCSGGSGWARCWAIWPPAWRSARSASGLFTDPQPILHVAELGVVMFLFIIGLEMQPSRLWSLRRADLRAGRAQVARVRRAADRRRRGAGGFAPPVAFVAAMGFVLSSTAIVMQILDERGETAPPRGQRSCPILLLEDLPIVPLLAHRRLPRADRRVGARRVALARASASRVGVAGRPDRRRRLAAQPAVPRARRRARAR